MRRLAIVFVALFELSSADEFHVVGMSSNVLWRSLDFVTPTGETGRIERGVRASVTICTYTGAVSGNKYPLSSGPAAG